MFIIRTTYKAPLSEVDKYLTAHRDFLDLHYKKGLLIASGPTKPRTGGIIIATTKDREYLESVLKEDPFYLAEIADYELTEFVPVKHCNELKDRIFKMEGE